MIVVGGVPGAGKSTLLDQVGRDVPRSVVLDPDRHRRRIACRLPSWVPYGAYRWAVHGLHAVETVARVVRGPRTSVPLLVHDTATRPVRRRALGLLARARGWEPVLVAVDVSLTDALDGQLDRGRVVRPQQFVRHWERWTVQRPRLTAVADGARGPWSDVHVLSRARALDQVRELARRAPAVVPAGVGAGAATSMAPARPGTPCAA
ncbi:hypothetical protein APR03_002741 [Promicromonospora thailandica]|uniref:AAA domain-containing protein n=2 Tax=Promicromonospora thailandica TaxID=765201 RepID=A0A9X2G406_9MICO|nr:hypothetical protein [Promicromonospora thailandica]